MAEVGQPQRRYDDENVPSNIHETSLFFIFSQEEDAGVYVSGPAVETA